MEEDPDLEHEVVPIEEACHSAIQQLQDDEALYREWLYGVDKNRQKNEETIALEVRKMEVKFDETRAIVTGLVTSYFDELKV